MRVRGEGGWPREDGPTWMCSTRTQRARGWFPTPRPHLFYGFQAGALHGGRNYLVGRRWNAGGQAERLGPMAERGAGLGQEAGAVGPGHGVPSRTKFVQARAMPGPGMCL